MTLPVSSIRVANYRDKSKNGYEPCFICGRQLSAKYVSGFPLMVHCLTTNELTDAFEHPQSQGFFPIGKECAHKLPKNFIWGTKHFLG
jgi:hypothetical protein